MLLCISRENIYCVAILFPQKCNSTVMKLERENAQLKEEIEQLKQRLNELELISGRKHVLDFVFFSGLAVHCQCSNSASVYVFRL